MNLHTQLRQIALLGALSIGAQASWADVTVYQDASAFKAATQATGTDDFFGVPQDAPAGSQLSRLTLIGGRYGYMASASSSSLLGAGTAGDVWLTSNVATDTLTFNHFSQAITAFGGSFFGSDFNGQYLQGGITLTMTDASGATFSKEVMADSSSSFLGFVSSGPSIVSVTLSATQLDSGDSLWPTARMVVVGQAISAVPEPSSIALMIAGLSSIQLLRRRRARPTQR